MDRQLILSSHSVKNQNGNKPSDFTIKYINPIILDPNRQYEIGLNRIISMSFTWFNVTKELNNQKIRYSSDSGTNWTELIFNPGVWNYVDFIYSFSTSTLTPSYSFTQEPRRVQFNPLNKNTINKIRIYISDGKRRIINLNHSDTSFSLILREKKD